MKLRSCLYCLSLFLVVSCAPSNPDKVAELEGRMDSLSAAHQVEVDSLQVVLEDQGKVIDELNAGIASLRDSLAELLEGNGKVGPTHTWKDFPRGDPVRDGD